MNPVALYADGGVIGSNPSKLGGTWAWCWVSASGERIRTASGKVLPRTFLPLITNNVTEYVALVKGLESLPEGWSGAVYSDSKITLGRLFAQWRCNGLPLVLVRQGAAAVARLDWANINPILLDGHPAKAQLLAGRGKRGNPVSIHNVWCDAVCAEEARKYREFRSWCEERVEVSLSLDEPGALSA